MFSLIFNRILLFCILTNVIFSQITNIQIRVDTERLRKAINNELDNFELTLFNYIRLTEFAPDAMDIDFTIELHFFIEEIKKKGNFTQFNAQLLAHNGLDQQYFSKGLEFSYYPGQNIYYNGQFESLRSIIDYYVFLIIAGDLDTYDYLGGETYYKKAEEIALSGKNSSFNRGWSDRRQKVKFLNNNIDLRKAKLHFFIALDNYYNPQVITNDTQLELEKFYNSIIDIDINIGNDKDTQVFLKGHADQIGLMFNKFNMFEEIVNLIQYDNMMLELLNKYLPEDYHYKINKK